jgi:RHS repeat-associated protein
VDEPLRKEVSGANSYYHADGLSSITATTDALGAVIATRRYDAWGNIDGGTLDSAFAFTGREYDPETGLHYYRARYYAADAGRFINEDPVGFTSGDVNLYSYVYNRPTNLVDPYGLTPFEVLYFCERHRQRNHFNRCPAAEPKDDPDWKKDFWGSGKYRSSDGSECAYDDCGKLKADENNNYTFNYEPETFLIPPIPSPRHLFWDVLPHFLCGPIHPNQTDTY